MRTHRLLLRELSAGRRTLFGADAHHLRDVLRVRPGSRVEAFDGAGVVALGEVASVSAECVELVLQGPQPGSSEPSVALTVAPALLKGDKLTDVVRKATELGAGRFTPVVAERCDVRALTAPKLQRLRRVAEEAAKQSQRSRVPEVAEPVALAELDCEGLMLVADPGAAASLRDALQEGAPRHLTIVTGPEGGLTRREVDELLGRGARAIRLGTRVLRAETAPVALAAAILVPEAL